jgi:hypothetical protein
MGIAYYISSSDGDTSYSSMMDGKGLGRALDKVSCMGQDAGMKRLDDYVSQRREELLELIPEGIDSFENPQLLEEQWYDSTMGVALIEQYIEKLKAYGFISRTEKEDSLQDLEDMRSILGILSEKSLKWHLSLDI